MILFQEIVVYINKEWVSGCVVVYINKEWGELVDPLRTLTRDQVSHNAPLISQIIFLDLTGNFLIPHDSLNVSHPSAVVMSSAIANVINST